MIRQAPRFRFISLVSSNIEQCEEVQALSTFNCPNEVDSAQIIYLNAENRLRYSQYQQESLYQTKEFHL